MQTELLSNDYHSHSYKEYTQKTLIVSGNLAFAEVQSAENLLVQIFQWSETGWWWIKIA